MKLKTFEKLMVEVQNQHNKINKKVEVLNELFEGIGFEDERVFNDSLISIALKDLKAEDWIYDLVYDVISGDVDTFNLRGYEFNATFRNIWLYCKGRFNEISNIDPRDTQDTIDKNQEKYIENTLKEVNAEIGEALEEFVFEINNSNTREKMKNVINQVCMQFCYEGKINDFKVESDSTDFTDIIVSIQIHEGTEGYTTRIRI